MGFSQQEYWSGLPFSSPGDLPDPGIKPATAALAGGIFTAQPPEKPLSAYIGGTVSLTGWCSLSHFLVQHQPPLSRMSVL